MGRFIKFVLASLGLWLSMSATASAACTNASVNGPYGMALSGTDGSGHQVAGVFLLTPDGAGNVTGHGTVNDNGIVSTPSFSGTYTLAANCTGTITIPGSTMTFVVDDSGKQMQLLVVVTGDGQRAGVAIAQGVSVCTAAATKGSYGSWYSQGTNSSVEQATFKKGKLTGTGAVASSGLLLTVQSTGTYTVNPECFVATNLKTTFYLNGVVAGNTTATSAGILVRGGTQILDIDTGNPASTGFVILQK
jgi:hypothetical protein